MATKSIQAEALDREPTDVLQTGILGGRLRTAQFELNLEGEAAGTVFDLTELPSNAVIQRIELRQNTSSTTQFDIGDKSGNDRVVDGQAINQNLTLSVTSPNGGTNGMDLADFQKQLWEVLGYNDRIEPGGNIRLQARNPSAAVSSGKLFGSIFYVVD